MEEPTTKIATEAVKEEVKEKASSAWNKFSSFFQPSEEHGKTTRVVTKVETVSTDELYKGRSLFEVLGETGKLWGFYISEKYSAAKGKVEAVKHNFEEKKHALDHSPTWNSAVKMIKAFGTGVKERSCHAYDVFTHSKVLDRLTHSKGYDALVHNKAVQDVSAKSKAVVNSFSKSWEKLNETFWEFWEPVEEEAKKVAPKEEIGQPSTITLTPTSTTTTTTPIILTPTPIPTSTTTTTTSSATTQPYTPSTFSYTPPKETEMKSYDKPSGSTTSTTTTTTGTTDPLAVKRPPESFVAREQNV